MDSHGCSKNNVYISSIAALTVEKGSSFKLDCLRFSIKINSSQSHPCSAHTKIGTKQTVCGFFPPFSIITLFTVSFLTTSWSIQRNTVFLSVSWQKVSGRLPTLSAFYGQMWCILHHLNFSNLVDNLPFLQIVFPRFPSSFIFHFWNHLAFYLWKS